MLVHPLHARSEQGLLFLKHFVGDIAWIVTPPGQRMRDELDLCSLKKFSLAAPQNHLNHERSVGIMLPLASCCDGSKGSATSSLEGIGFSELGEPVIPAFWLSCVVTFIPVKMEILILSHKGETKIFHFLGKCSNCTFVKEGWGTVTPTSSDLHSYAVCGLWKTPLNHKTTQNSRAQGKTYISDL